MTELENKMFEVVAPVEIDKACNDIRLMLADIPWVTHPYNIAQRFFRKEENRNFIYPETYIKNIDDSTYKYHRLTPDNKYTGMFFFMVGPERPVNFTPGQQNVLSYPVSIIFSANLELIDKARLKNDGMFTQELIRDARRVLTEGMYNFDFTYKLVATTRDLREVYREFSLSDIEQYNRLPLQCWRMDLEVTLSEEC